MLVFFLAGKENLKVTQIFPEGTSASWFWQMKQWLIYMFRWQHGQRFPWLLDQVDHESCPQM